MSMLSVEINLIAERCPPGPSIRVAPGWQLIDSTRYPSATLPMTRGRISTAFSCVGSNFSLTLLGVIFVILTPKGTRILAADIEYVLSPGFHSERSIAAVISLASNRLIRLVEALKRTSIAFTVSSMTSIPLGGFRYSKGTLKLISDLGSPLIVTHNRRANKTEISFKWKFFKKKSFNEWKYRIICPPQPQVAPELFPGQSYPLI